MAPAVAKLATDVAVGQAVDKVGKQGGKQANQGGGSKIDLPKGSFLGKNKKSTNVNDEVLKYGNFAKDTTKMLLDEGEKFYKDVNDYEAKARTAYNNERTTQRKLDANFGQDVDSFNKWDKTERTAETANRVLSTFNVNRRAILWIVVIIAVLYIIFRKKINSLFSDIADMFIENDKQKSITKQYGKLGLKASEIRAMADSIESYWNGAGEDEDAVIAQICRLKTQADWEYLKEIYGERPVYGAQILFFSAKKMGTYSLESAINTYFTTSQKTEIKNHLTKINVKSVSF